MAVMTVHEETTQTEFAVKAVGLTKRYGQREVLSGVDLSVRPGSILGLLGPNGAGKTTTVHILTTLLEPDDGHAVVAGYDVRRQPREVRRALGLTGQYPSVDETMTARENLTLFGNLLHLGRRPARERAAELLEQFELTSAGDRPVRTYSGGMRRRLDLAVSIVGAPAILFLDEPSTGLDPHSRLAVWNLIRQQAANGVTVLLTTQYMEEADYLADQIVVIDSGQVIAEGTPDQLKRKIGKERLVVSMAQADAVKKAAEVLSSAITGELIIDHRKNSLSIALGDDNISAIAAVAEQLRSHGIPVDEFALRRPSLDDVFLGLTGHATDSGAAGKARSSGRTV